MRGEHLGLVLIALHLNDWKEGEGRTSAEASSLPISETSDTLDRAAVESAAMRT